MGVASFSDELTLRAALPLRHGDRTAIRSGRAFDRRWREDIDELIFPVGDQLVEHQVLVVENAVLCLQLPVDHEGEILVGVRHDLDRPGVGCRQAEILLDHPARDFEADARLAVVVAVVVLHPERSPAGIEEDRIARFDVVFLHVLALQCRPDVRERNFLARVHHPAFHRLDVDEMAAREQRLQLLGSELLQAIGVADLGGGEAVVEMHLALVAVLAELDADVAEAVKLRADLADFGREELVVIDELVRAERAAGRATGNAQRECARAEQRHALLVGAADLVDLAVANPFDGIENLGRRDVVRGSGFVGRAPFRGPPFRRRRGARSALAPA